MKLLLEMRPALDGHAGIPQETRLLFRGLSRLDGVQVEGLLQSSTRVLARGIPPGKQRLSRDRQVNRLSRVVVSLQTRGDAGRLERLWAAFRLSLVPARTIVSGMLGVRHTLGIFEADHFKDFIWRGLFARTLPNADFDLVTKARYRVARMPWSALHATGLLTRRLGHALYPRLDTRGFDVMIAETPYPGRVDPGTRLVVRYHDAIPLLMPHTISDRSHHQASHYHALRRNIRDGAWFACVSDATRRDLLAVFPEVADRAVTIPNMVSHHYHPEASMPERIPDIFRIRRHPEFEASAPVISRGSDGVPYLLMVSTIEPRKNHLTLLAAWEQLRAEGWADLQLVFVGMLGWDHKAIVKKLRPWTTRGGLHILEDVPSDELRLLYRHARVTVCPSFGEGFDYSGIEAMRCGGVVAASDIAVHRDVFGDAAEYFSAYASRDLAAALVRLLGRDEQAAARRQALVVRGERVSAQYVPDRVLPQWQTFLNSLTGST
ncbi:MAG: glycosyltransferase family 1 protein [Burkholderiaceae bacterium]